jgi:hypothetical protein
MGPVYTELTVTALGPWGDVICSGVMVTLKQQPLPNIRRTACERNTPDYSDLYLRSKVLDCAAVAFSGVRSWLRSHPRSKSWCCPRICLYLLPSRYWRAVTALRSLRGGKLSR